ncbi:MAG: hypothetical protein ACLFPL_02400 [Candidatus Nanoarchaeia archaeon]
MVATKKTTPKTDMNSKLDKMLKNQEIIIENEQKILGEEARIISKEEEIENFEREEFSKEESEIHDEKTALDGLLELQQKLENHSKQSMRKITKKDFFKGFIGSFIGVISHFAFIKAVDVSAELSFTRASALYVVAAVIIITMLYYTGFKQIQKRLIFSFIPLRATILYVVSIFTILFVNFLFGQIESYQPLDLYNLIAANIILAVIGAGTADLIGRVEEE